jgi:hypothetical protein
LRQRSAIFMVGNGIRDGNRKQSRNSRMDIED